jgi:superfamily I DNA/RNA helicase
MTRISDEQVRALRSLDINDRVLVSGVAGSGKTRLALWWANQSARAGRSTFLTCYNDPLSKYLASACVPYPTLTVGPFLRAVSQFPGVPQLEEPADPSERDDFWNSQMIDHLQAHAADSQMKFETIVIDERQDFNDEWMEIIEKLLVDENSKILCVADQNQDLYDRGFFMPEGGSPWALAELRINCRNTREIAAFVQRFGGGMSASASLEGDPVKFVVANSEDELINAVLTEIRRFQLALGQNVSELVVITGTSAERDLFYDINSSEIEFSKWEDRGESSVACETVKRAKGIEAGHVIFATLNQEIKKNEMYVGASRARTSLVFIGPNELLDRIKTI